MSRKRRVTTCSQVSTEITSEMASKTAVRKETTQMLSARTLETSLETSLEGRLDNQGLPSEAYTSQDYLNRERQSVFSQHWICVGFASDVPNAGDVHPAEVAGMPIMLVRAGRGKKTFNQDSSITAFHNICRHRGLQLVDKACNVQGHLRCPYHSWAYRLDGSLKSTPHFGGYYRDSPEGFNRAEKGLKSIRCEQWLDLVFVNLSGDAPPLSEYLQPITERWSGYDLSLLRREPKEVALQCNANWKLAVENFSESYHLSWVHPALNGYSRMEDHFSFEVGDTHVGQGSLLYRCGEIEGRRLPVFPHLEKRGAQQTAEYITAFPNLMLGVHPDYFLVFLVDPLSPDKSVERMVFYFVGDEAMTPENEALRHFPIDLWEETNDEDIVMIERMQAGRKSPVFDGGCFSPALERPVYQFQQKVAESIRSLPGL